MKIQVKCEMGGDELIEYFLNQTKANNIDAAPESVKIVVTNSKGAEIDLEPSKIKLVYSKE